MRVKSRKVFIFLIVAVPVIAGYILYPRNADLYALSQEERKVATKEVAFQSGDIYLKGKIVYPLTVQNGARFPAVIILHGTSTSGMNLPLYRILSIELAKKGSIVLIYNQRGYDTSPDPPLNSRGGYILDYTGDVVNAVKFLSSQPNVDPSGIIVAGHSFGGSVAVSVAHLDSAERMIRKVVVISPGRGWPFKGEQKYIFRQKRLSRDMKLKKLITVENIKTLFADMEAESLVGFAHEMPVTLINGEYEEADKPLREIYGGMTGPSELKIIPETGHYFGTDYLLNRISASFVIYKKDVMAKLVKAILE